MASKAGTLNKKQEFPVEAYSDGVIIRRLNIKDINQKRAEKGKLIIGEALPPKNMMELEKKKLEENLQYENVESDFLKKWDEHPNQAIVMAVGPGRDIGGGTLLVPGIKVGQHIYYRPKSGDPIVVNKRLYWVIKDYDVLGLVPAADLVK
jgi:co-chaperonin GroES (HSP10)